MSYLQPGIWHLMLTGAFFPRREESAFTLASELKLLEPPAPPTHTRQLQSEGLCTDPALSPATLTLSTELRTTSSCNPRSVWERWDALPKSNLENQTPAWCCLPLGPFACSHCSKTPFIKTPPANSPWRSNTPNWGQCLSVTAAAQISNIST